MCTEQVDIEWIRTSEVKAQIASLFLVEKPNHERKSDHS